MRQLTFEVTYRVTVTTDIDDPKFSELTAKSRILTGFECKNEDSQGDKNRTFDWEASPSPEKIEIVKNVEITQPGSLGWKKGKWILSLKDKSLNLSPQHVREVLGLSAKAKIRPGDYDIYNERIKSYTTEDLGGIGTKGD